MATLDAEAIEIQELLTNEFITILRELTGDEIAHLVGHFERDGFVFECISSVELFQHSLITFWLHFTPLKVEAFDQG